MPLSNFAFTMLAIALILVLAGAPLIAIYICCGVAAVWQFLVTFAVPDAPVTLEDDDEPRDA